MNKKFIALGGLTSVFTVAPIATIISCSDGWKQDKAIETVSTISFGANGMPLDNLGFAKDMNIKDSDPIIAGGRKVIWAYIGKRAQEINMSVIPKENDFDVYSYEVKNNKLTLKGSSPVALAHGFYEYVKSKGYGMVDWSWSNIELPKTLPNIPLVKVVSPYKHHFLYNTVTPGYTTPFFDEAQWTKQINWMAMHGYDISFAGVGTEAIYGRVLEKLGYSKNALNNYFAGPAYYPWQRMGNLKSWDSNPYKQSWDKKQIALQKHILNYMKELKMIPIANGFAGFVPKDIASKEGFQKLADISEDNPVTGRLLTEMNWVLASSSHNHLLDPSSEMGAKAFAGIERMYVEEYQKEFGKENNHYFLSDLFNEMALPSAEQIGKISKTIYKGMIDADPDATWVTQGWGFSAQRAAWSGNNRAKFKALGQDVPDDKMVIISTAEDYAALVDDAQYNFDLPDYRLFNNKKWIFSTIPNMGGNTPFKGNLDFYARGGYDALHSTVKGNLWGYGTSPEGQENNTIIQELISDLGWKEKEWYLDSNTIKSGWTWDSPGFDSSTNPSELIKKKNWLDNYSLNRYKLKEDDGQVLKPISDFWLKITSPGGAYSITDRGPLFDFQKNPSPSSGTWNPYPFNKLNGSQTTKNAMIQSNFVIMNDLIKSLNDSKYKSKINDLVNGKNKDNPWRGELFKQDIYEISTHFYGAILDKILNRAKTLTSGDSKLVDLKKQAMEIFDKMDRTLSNHQLFNIDRWNKFAEHWADTESQKIYYRSDAQRIVSIWDAGGSLMDYAGKTWAGLIRCWDKPRWESWFNNKIDSTQPTLAPLQLRNLVNNNDWAVTPKNWAFSWADVTKNLKELSDKIGTSTLDDYVNKL